MTSLNRNESLSAVAIQLDGRIVVAGFRLSGVGGPDMIVMRYTATGRVDLTFANGSMRSLDFGGTHLASGLALQPDGKVLVGGWTQANDSSAFALARYNGDGSLDGSFGSGGKVVTDFGGQRAWGSGHAATGWRSSRGWRDHLGERSRDYALARYDADGSLDPGFGSGGVVTAGFGGSQRLGRERRRAARRKDRRCRRQRRRLRCCPLRTRRLGGYGIRGRRQADHRLRGLGARGRRCNPARWKDPRCRGAVDVWCRRGVSRPLLGDVFVVMGPVVSVPASVSGEATCTEQLGAIGSFVRREGERPDESAPTPLCSPESGSTFPIGTTTVTCTSSDTSGNVGSASFVVTVSPTALPDRYAVVSGRNSLRCGARCARERRDFVGGRDVARGPAGVRCFCALGGRLIHLYVAEGLRRNEMFDYVVMNAGLTSRAATVTLSIVARGADCELTHYPVAKDGSIVMRGANLGGCYLAGAALAGANLGNASLVGADLAGASLVRARLVQANLARAIVDGADLAVADLTNARRSGSTLAGSNLTGVIGVGRPAPTGRSVQRRRHLKRSSRLSVDRQGRQSFMGRGGIEPPTLGLRVPCSAN